MNSLLIKTLTKLKTYCEKEQYMGWDPFDGLNSKVFQCLPFAKSSAICRLITIQGFKRNPFNMRKIALIPKQLNAKGIGLFIQGYVNLYHCVTKHPSLSRHFGTQAELKLVINDLCNLLISMRSKGEYHGACWGYNFDWQSRRQFLFPKYTPTVVATSFCATAIIEAYEITHDKRHLETALSSANFVIKDLNRTKISSGGFLFSYSKFHGNDTVYNASLLGSRLLSYCYKHTGNAEYAQLAKESIIACCNGQLPSGAWPYGTKSFQGWVDSFHTGYNLDALITYQEITGDMVFNSYIEKGFNYYIKNHFDQNSEPKYYDNKKYPIDIHCPGQLFVTLTRLHKFSENKTLAEKVLNWTVENMQDEKGYFYYQLKQGISSKISYMRWSNAFMFYALSYYLLNE